MNQAIDKYSNFTNWLHSDSNNSNPKSDLIKVISAKIIQSHVGPDTIELKLEATTVSPSYFYEAYAKVNCASMYGVEWFKLNFPNTPFEVY